MIATHRRIAKVSLYAELRNASSAAIGQADAMQTWLHKSPGVCEQLRVLAADGNGSPIKELYEFLRKIAPRDNVTDSETLERYLALKWKGKDR